MPATTAAIANTPIGVRATTKLVAFETARPAVASTSSSGALFGTPMSADADDDAEQHDRGHDVVGERVERIGRDVEVQEVERLPFLEQRRAEERRVLIAAETSAGTAGPRRAPPPRAARRIEPDPLPERPRLRGIERAEPADDRDRHVRQDRHLQQLDVGVGDDLQRRRPLADEQPERDAGGDRRRRSASTARTPVPARAPDCRLASSRRVRRLAGNAIAARRARSHRRRRRRPIARSTSVRTGRPAIGPTASTSADLVLVDVSVRPLVHTSTRSPSSSWKRSMSIDRARPVPPMPIVSVRTCRRSRAAAFTSTSGADRHAWPAGGGRRCGRASAASAWPSRNR